MLRALWRTSPAVAVEAESAVGVAPEPNLRVLLETHHEEVWRVARRLGVPDAAAGGVRRSGEEGASPPRVLGGEMTMDPRRLLEEDDDRFELRLLRAAHADRAPQGSVARAVLALGLTASGMTVASAAYGLSAARLT